MSRNATPSWSGYAHQGKIGLLVALRRINALHGTQGNLVDYVLGYETQEDVKISYLGNVLEVHQVKALRSSSTIGSYTDALEAYEPCPGVNYLHSICEITNWATLTALQNPSGVLRYPYSAALSHCTLDQIFEYIDNEIEILLRNLNHENFDNPGWRANAFQEFLSTLDEKIRFEHQNHDANSYNISFTLLEVTGIMESPPSKIKSKLCAIRKELFHEYFNFINAMDANVYILTHEHEMIISDAMRVIYELPDEHFKQFLRNINPHTTEGKKFEACETTHDFFVSENFSGTFLYTLIQVTESIYSIDSRVIPNYFKLYSYLMTSIQSIEIHKQLFAKRILENENVNFSGYETDFIITQNYTGELGECAPKILQGSSEKFISRKKMKFIPVNEAINILNS